jgi:hypothetical protein
LLFSCVREQTMQRILSAEDIASSPFQDWLKEQNNAGADVDCPKNSATALFLEDRKTCFAFSKTSP